MNVTRRSAFALIGTVAFALAGCSTEQPDVESDKELALAYLQSDEVQNYTKLSDLLADCEMLYTQGNYEECYGRYEEICEIADALIDMENVPEIASKSHEHLTDNASITKEVALSYAMATTARNSGNTETHDKLIAGINDKVGLLTESADRAAVALNEMNEKVNRDE